MKAIFISDAHLRKAGDERYKKLLKFFDAVQAGHVMTAADPGTKSGGRTLIDHLYIAGDLFDFWFCPKEKINPEFKPVIDKLNEMKNSGISIHLCEGNHDFFMKDYFADVLGLDVAEKFMEARLDHLNVLIAHGDTADSTDSNYLMLRKILRSNVFYNFQRFIPVSVRWSLAGLFSTTSKALTTEDGSALVKKMEPFALDKFREGFDAVILGHCHVPGINHYDVNSRKRTFVTLGDWITHYSFVYYENNNFFIHRYRG